MEIALHHQEKFQRKDQNQETKRSQNQNQNINLHICQNNN